MSQPLEQSDVICDLRGNVSMGAVDVMRVIHVREARPSRRGIATQYCVKTDNIADVVQIHRTERLFPS